MVVNKVGMSIPQPPSVKSGNTTTSAPLKAFSDVLSDALGSTVQAQETAEALSTAVAQGESVPAHKVIEAVNAAEIKLQTLVTVRDRAVQAYQQLTQMPI